MGESGTYRSIIMEQYKLLGEKYSGHSPLEKPHTKIYELSDDYIKSQLKELNTNKDRTQIHDIYNDCWITIFNDVLYKRRINKLNKVINNIKK